MRYVRTIWAIIFASIFIGQVANAQVIGDVIDQLDPGGSDQSGGNTSEDYSGVMDSFDIISATTSAALSCMDWSPVGGCLWMTCYLVACDFDFSLKVENFAPDITLQSYNRAKGEPWTESHTINSLAQAHSSSWVEQLISVVEDFSISHIGIRGGVTTEGNKHQHANLHFKLVDAYGNPGISAFNQIASSFGLFCGGSTTMFVPYFISTLDSVAWRWDMPEMLYPQSLLPIVTTWDLGSSTNNWGPIYPRHGFMTAQDPLKSAVLSAFRAAHVFTRNGQAHLYVSIAESPRDGYWPPGPLDQHDSKTGKWQMLYPREEDNCRSFPYQANPSSSYRSNDASYIWNFWRSYKCCEKKGSELIYDFG